MKLFVPDIGTIIRLEQDWQITLYNEYRNTLFETLGLPRKTTVVELPKGLILKVNRIYIRQGLSQYSSITFTCPAQKTKADKLKNPQNVKFGGSKFWVKLHECNGLSIETETSNEETVSAIKKIYEEIENDINNIKGTNVYISTHLLRDFNSYLGTGLNINNLHTNLTPDHFLNNMVSRISSDNDQTLSNREYFKSKIKLYLREYKLNQILP